MESNREKSNIAIIELTIRLVQKPISHFEQKFSITSYNKCQKSLI